MHRERGCANLFLDNSGLWSWWNKYSNQKCFLINRIIKLLVSSFNPELVFFNKKEMTSSIHFVSNSRSFTWNYSKYRNNMYENPLHHAWLSLQVACFWSANLSYVYISYIFPQVRNIESWLVYLNTFSWITQSYFFFLIVFQWYLTKAIGIR